MRMAPRPASIARQKRRNWTSSSLIRARVYTQLSTSISWLKNARKFDTEDKSLSNTVKHLLTIGRYFASFYSNTEDWLIRRIDTVDIVGETDAVSRSSVTLDGLEIAKIRARAHISPDAAVHIPLPAMKKQLLGQFDARLGTDPIPLLSSVDNSHAATGVMLAYLVDHGVTLSQITFDIINFLYHVASTNIDDPFYRSVAAQLNIEAERAEQQVQSPGLGTHQDYSHEFDRLIEITLPMGRDEFRYLSQMLADFLTNFIPIGVVGSEHAQSEFIVKTMTVATQVEYKPKSQARQVQSYHSQIWLFINVCLYVAYTSWVWLKLTVRDLLAALKTLRRYEDFRAQKEYRNRLRKYRWLRRKVLASQVWEMYCQIWYRFRRAARIRRAARRIDNPHFVQRIEAHIYEAYVWFQPILRIPTISGIFEVSSSDTNLGLYGSQHFRILIPDGAMALAATIRSDFSIPTMQGRTVENWVALHATNVDRLNTSTIRSTVHVLPRTQGFLAQAFYAAIVTMVLFTLGLVAELFGWLFHRSSGTEVYGIGSLAMRSSGAIATVLMVAPSIYTVILLRQNEHGFVALLLQNVRKVTGVCALVSASVVIPIILIMPWPVVLLWWLAGWFSALIAIWHLTATRNYHRLATRA